MVTRKRIMNQLLAADEKFKRIVSVCQRWYFVMMIMMMIMIVGWVGCSDGIEAMTHYYVMTFSSYRKWGWISTITILRIYMTYAHVVEFKNIMVPYPLLIPRIVSQTFSCKWCDNWRCALAVILCCACVSSNVVCRIDIIVQVHSYYMGWISNRGCWREFNMFFYWILWHWRCDFL